MAAAQRGDADSYRSLMAELQTVLTPFLRRQLAGPELVEDCVQESLLAIHKARHTYDPARPFKPWAYTLARYKSVDAIRRSNTRRRHEPTDLPADSVEQAGAPAAEPPLDTAKALEGLAPKFREAVVLTKLHGYTVAEAATKAGVSRAAMRSRLHRGLNQLHRHFAQALR